MDEEPSLYPNNRLELPVYDNGNCRNHDGNPLSLEFMICTYPLKYGAIRMIEDIIVCVTEFRDRIRGMAHIVVPAQGIPVSFRNGDGKFISKSSVVLARRDLKGASSGSYSELRQGAGWHCNLGHLSCLLNENEDTFATRNDQDTRVELRMQQEHVHADTLELLGACINRTEDDMANIDTALGVDFRFVGHTERHVNRKTILDLTDQCLASLQTFLAQTYGNCGISPDISLCLNSRRLILRHIRLLVPYVDLTADGSSDSGSD